VFSEIAIALAFVTSRNDVKSKVSSSFFKSPVADTLSKPKVGFVESSNSLLPPQTVSTTDGPRYMSKRKSMVTASST